MKVNPSSIFDVLLDTQNRIKWETQATQVIKEKIKHFKKTGNKRKLAIYESKLQSKTPLLAELRKSKSIIGQVSEKFRRENG